MKKRGSPLGSNSSTEGGRFKIGRLGKPNGLQGFLGFYVDEADLDRLEPGTTVTVADRLLTVRATRPGKKGPQIAFSEITDRDGAEAVRGHWVELDDSPTLGEDQFWIEELIGLEVRPGGGEVVGIEHGPAQDRLVIQRNGTRFEVPFVEALVPVVDVASGFIQVDEVEGLD